MHNLIAKLKLFLEHATAVFGKRIDSRGNFSFYSRKPKLSDIEIIALSVCAEAHSWDSENWLYSHLRSNHPEFFKELPHRTNYNRRKRKLQEWIDEFSHSLAERMIEKDEWRIIDSMPMPICRKARAAKCRIMKDNLDMLPRTGYQPIDQQHYFGYKFHAMVSESGVLANFCLTPANVHDVKMMAELTEKFAQGCTVLGDKGYISRQGQLELFEKAGITVITPARKNMKAAHEWKGWMNKKRRRIETTFAQDCDQFMMKRNYAKTFLGLFTRITAKIAAYTWLQYLNYLTGKPLSQVKHTIYS